MKNFNVNAVMRDVLADWIDECTEDDSHAEEELTDLWESWERFGGKGFISTPSDLAGALEDMGYLYIPNPRRIKGMRLVA